MAVVLASDVAGYVTGTTVFVDGGMTDYPAFAHGG
jgi:enoyl-[acyl-carrier-protein] reductase (NADH)